MRKHFSCLKSMNRLLFHLTIFLHFVLYLLWFSTHKKLLYTKLMEIIWGFHRTLPFYFSCSRTRVISSEASPLFFLVHPLYNETTLCRNPKLCCCLVSLLFFWILLLCQAPIGGTQHHPSQSNRWAALHGRFRSTRHQMFCTLAPE